MGLDINFIKVKHRVLADDVDVRDLPDEETEFVAYFRKVNFLIPFFDYEEDCSYVEIDKEQVEKLVKTCDLVLKCKPQKGKNLTKKAKDEVHTLLPTTDGFFFGNTDYNDWYFEDVKNVKDTFSELLKTFNWEENALFMLCSW